MNFYYICCHHNVVLDADVWGYLTATFIDGGVLLLLFIFVQDDDEESFIWTLMWPFFDVLVDVVEVLFLWEDIKLFFCIRTGLFFNFC
jgi:hypothetical protein